MNKKGFTLSELLVALGIVAVVAAITIPAIHKIMPDKDKGTVLKVYKTISEINQEIFNNPSLYNFSDSACNGSSQIIQCYSAPQDGKHPTAVRFKKYPILLIQHLNLADHSVSIGATGNCQFDTADGLTWIVEHVETDYSGAKKPKSYKITIVTNNSNRDNSCTYSHSCKNPGRFSFKVNGNGSVEGADSLTKAYLLNPNEINSRTADLKKAEEILGPLQHYR